MRKPKSGKPTYFNPDGNDLKRVFYYYGLEFEEKIVCPFHDDSRPSCHVNFDDGKYHCFACEASGDAHQFVKMANPKLSDLQILILYFAILNSDKVGKLKLSKNRSTKSVKKKLEDKSYEQEMSYDFYHGLATVDWKKTTRDNLPYKKYMLSRGFSPDALNETGAKLTIVDKNYPLIFPMFDNGEFRGYVCRTTTKAIEDKRKYLYNKGFSRIDTLGGNYEGEVVVICEGYMDRLKLLQFGLKNSVAIFGWKITSKQVEKLRAKGIKTVISALDMDKPGKQGTNYLNNFFNVVQFQFPEGVKDPGDLNKEQFDIAYKKTKILYKKMRRNS